MWVFRLRINAMRQLVDSYHSPHLVCSCPGPKGSAGKSHPENCNWDFTHDINHYKLEIVDKQTRAHSSVSWLLQPIPNNNHSNGFV